MSGRRKGHPRKPSRRQSAEFNPRELPFYRLLPPEAWRAFQNGLVMQEMEDRWATSLVDTYLDFYFSWSRVHVYRLFVHRLADAVQVGPVLLMTEHNTALACDDDEEHMAIVEGLIGRMLGNPGEMAQTLFTANLRRWSKDIVERFRARKAPNKRR